MDGEVETSGLGCRPSEKKMVAGDAVETGFPALSSFANESAVSASLSTRSTVTTSAARDSRFIEPEWSMRTNSVELDA